MRLRSTVLFRKRSSSSDDSGLGPGYAEGRMEAPDLYSQLFDDLAVLLLSTDHGHFE